MRLGIHSIKFCTENANLMDDEFRVETFAPLKFMAQHLSKL
jgi:hypothetical protein